MSTTTMLPLGKITLDEEVQSRAKLDSQHCEDLAEDLRNGAELPAVVVYFDGESYWLSAGFHRWHAHKRAGRSHIECEVRQGGRDAAILYAATTNFGHGLRRTPADKRRAIHLTLANPLCAGWSAEKIADHCRVSADLVRAVQQSTRWEPPVTLFGDKDLENPPAPDYALAPIAERVDRGKVTSEQAAAEMDAADVVEIRERVRRLVRKLCRYASVLGEEAEELVREYR